MTDQSVAEQRTAAAAADAADDSEVGVDGDDRSVADGAGKVVHAPAPTGEQVASDPVTGTTDDAVGLQQARDDEAHEPAG